MTKKLDHWLQHEANVYPGSVEHSDKPASTGLSRAWTVWLADTPSASVSCLGRVEIRENSATKAAPASTAAHGPDVGERGCLGACHWLHWMTHHLWPVTKVSRRKCTDWCKCHGAGSEVGISSTQYRQTEWTGQRLGHQSPNHNLSL